MTKIRIVSILITPLILLMPAMASALQMPTSVFEVAEMEGLTARSYLVMDKLTGQVLVSKQPDLIWPPASLTKLVTALVVLDTKPNMSKAVAMAQSDQVAGGCNQGGACLSTKSGVKYRLKDLFYASLMASANNAAHAVARSTGLTDAQFADKMNQKAQSLGAINTHFNEPTGMDPANYTTVSDYAKITKAAFAEPFIHQIATTQNYNFRSTNYTKYYHKLKNTDKLLKDADLTIIGGKTGYLDESQYNFTAEITDRFGNDMIVTLFGSQSNTTQFTETKRLADLGGLAKAFSFFQSPVLGTTTFGSLTY